MERVTRAQGHHLVEAAKAASNLDVTFKVPYPVSRGSVTLTEAGLDLLLTVHQVAHLGPDPLVGGGRDGLGHGGVDDGAELLAGKPLSGIIGIDKQSSNKGK